MYARLIYLRKPYFFILLTKQRAYLYRIKCGIFLKLWLYFRKYLMLFWTLLKMFRHFRTFHICFLFLFCRSAGRSVLFWSPTRIFDPCCFSIKVRHQWLIEYSSRHSKKICVVCLKVTSSLCCFSIIITGVVVDCRIVRWDLKSRSS